MADPEMRSSSAHRRAAVLLAATLLQAPLVSGADEIADLKRELEASRALMQRLEQRILQLESSRAEAKTVAAEAKAVAVEAKAAVPAPASAPAEPAKDWSIDIYGFTQLDMIYDVDQSHPDWKDTLRVSKIPVNCPGDPGCGKDGETVFGVRQSRIGFKAKSPTPAGELSTWLEFELFGVGDDAGQTTPRLRHAWGEIGRLGAGQTWSLFMDPDVFPNTIDYWGPTGMMFLRNPQVRYTAYRTETHRIALALEAPGSALDTGKVQVIDPFDNPLNVQSENNLPDFTAQWRMSGEWGHTQLAGIVRQVGFETENVTNGPSGEEFGWGLNGSASLVFLERDKLHLQLAYGEGIASYINDGGNDLGPDDDLLGAASLPLLGVLAYYDHYWTEQWSSSVGWSYSNQETSGGQGGSAFDSAHYGNLNLLYYPAPSVMVGGELIYGRLILKDDTDAEDRRFQMSFKYKFD